MSDYDYNDVLQQSVFAARTANAAAIDSDPEQAARAIDLEDATGVPSTAIYGDVDGFERQHKLALGSQIISDNQFISDWLSGHPMAARLSHDDLGSLDTASTHLADMFGDTRLSKWLKDDSIAKTFMEGYGDQPLGSSILSRPGEAEWALSHPEVASVAMAAATPVEFMSRATAGLLRLGHDGVQSIMGKSFADDLAGIAEMQMMRGDIGVHGAGGGGGEGLISHNTQLVGKIRDTARALQLADPWTKIGREPPPNIHPLIDQAKSLQAKEDIDAIDQAVTDAQQSATRDRSPEFYSNFAAGPLGQREIGIDSGAIRALYGDKIPETGDSVLGWIPGLGDRLKSAELTGDKIWVPAKDWVANVDPEINRALHDDIQARDGGVTINETKIGQDVEKAKPTEAKPPSEYEVTGADLAGDENEVSNVRLIRDKDGNVEAVYSDKQGIIKVPPTARGLPDEELITRTLGGYDTTGQFHGPSKVTARAETRHPGPQPKETGPDIVQQVRGSAGFEPLFSAGDRKLSLEMLPKPKDKAVPAWQAGAVFHDLDIKDESGNSVGTVNLSEQKGGKQLYIEMIQAGPKESGFYQPNYLGPAAMRDIARQLKTLFPKAFGPDGEGITGHRVSGARGKAGVEMTAPLPKVKFEVPEGWGEVEPFRQLLQGVWESMGSYEVLRGGMTLDQQVLAQAVERELGRIVPQKVGDIQTPLAARRGTGQEVGGTYQKFLQQYPRIIAALDRGSEAMGVARHEAIHHLRGYGFFTDSEWSTLERAARDEGWMKRYGIDTRYPDLETPKKLEEAIADGFRNWKEGGKANDKVHPIFEKLKAFIEAIKTAFKEATGRDLDWDEIFKKVDTGEVGGREGTGAREEGGHTPFDIKESVPYFAKDALETARGRDNEVQILQSRIRSIQYDMGLTRKAGFDTKGEDHAPQRNAIKALRNRIKEVQGGDFEPQAMIPEEPTGTESATGLYDRGKALGVTQAHMDRMLGLIEKRNAEDLAAANRRAEVRQRRRSNKEYKERRTTLRDEVREDLSARPDIALDSVMAKHKIKINPAYLSEDQRARLPKDYIQKKDGVNPDDLAPYFGYSSGDALVERLGILTEDRRRAGMSHRDYLNRLIDVETDRRLNQEFGNREQNILDEAKDQALSETQLDLVHEETMAYALKAGQEPQFDKEAVRAAVKADFDTRTVKDISSDKLLQQAGMIGKKIEEAAAKGDWEEAYRLSQKRNHSVIAAKFARDYEKGRRQFDKQAKSYSKNRTLTAVEQEYTNWVQDLLLRTGHRLSRSVQDLQENIGRQAPEDTLEKFITAKEAEFMGMRQLDVPDFLQDPDFRKPVDQLTMSEFEGLRQGIKILDKAGRDEKRVTVGGENWDRAGVLASMRQQLSTFGYSTAKFNLEQSKFKALRYMAYGLTNMETLMNRWDRGSASGLFNRVIIYPLVEAANGKARLLRGIADDLKKLSRPSKDELSKLVDAPFPDPASPDGQGEWTGFNKSNVLAMLQHAGNESNWNVLARGYGADPKALFAWLQKNVTKADVDRAVALGNIFKKLIAKSDQVYEHLTGATVEKIPLKPIEFKTADGQTVTTSGWYHPLDRDPYRASMWKEDPDTGERERVGSRSRESAFGDTDYFHAATSNGYTKKRTGAIYPVNLDYNMVPSRLRQMAHDINFREPILNIEKIFSNRLFREDVAKYYGKEYADGLMPYLRHLAGSEGIRSEAGSWADSFVGKSVQNIVSTYIGYNPFTVLKHGPTAWGLSMKQVGAQNFLKAVQELAKPGTADIHKFIMDNSEELQRRERHWADTLAGQGTELKAEGSIRDRVIENGSKWVAKSDMLSAKPTWWAAYQNAKAAGETHGMSVTLADRAVRLAHGSTAETNLPPAVRGGGAANRYLTAVYGFFGTVMQRRIEIAHQLNDMYQLGREGELREAAKNLPKLLHNFVAYVVMPTAVEELVTGITAEDKRGWGAHLLSGATMGIASSFLYARDLVYGLTTGHDPGAGLISSAMHDAANVARDVRRGREAFNREHAGKTVEDVLTLFGEATGAAPKAIAKAARFGIDVARGQQRPHGPVEWLRGVASGEAQRRKH